MRRRSRYGPTTGTPRPVPTTEAPTTRHTTVDPSELDGGRPFPFLAQLYLPSGMLRSIRATDALRAISRLAAPDGSWCEITRTPETAGRYTLREAGPTPLWARVEEAWTEWIELGQPAMHEFGVTATPTAHRIWLSDPEKSPHWKPARTERVRKSVSQELIPLRSSDVQPARESQRSALR